jgi:thiol:disulfide interchange protein DsbD
VRELHTPPEDNLVFRARLDPLAPTSGAKGTLFIDIELRKTVHVYADKRFKVVPVEQKGVTWGKPAVPEPVKWVDPNIGGDPEEVWFEKIPVQIPFEIAADAKYPLVLCATVRWSCCDDGTCYPPMNTKPPVGFTMRASGDVLPDPDPKKGPVAGPAPAGPQPAPAPAPNPPAPANPPPPANPPGNPPKEPPSEPAPPPGSAVADVAPAKAASVDFDGTAARVTVVVDASEVKATVTPHAGMHLYPPGVDDGKTVEINGTAAADVTWKPLVYPETTERHVTAPFLVRLPYEGRASESAPLRFTVEWQSCNEENCFLEGENFLFDGARVRRLEKGGKTPAPTAGSSGAGAPSGAGAHAPTASDDGSATPAAGGAAAIPATVLLFPALGDAPEESEFGELWKKWGILVLGWLFLTGILLAFTPCVLPIIPITISIIGGGSGTVSRKRLTVLLSFYVLGLSLAFGTMGVVSAVTGSAMSAAFQSPTAIWVIAGIFFLLALGMFGIYELQPPQWMQRLQGGAKGGNVIGAFLFGAMAAVIASPCTGPVIVSLVVFTAQSGSVFLGFLLFFTLGLGMGAVFFAAGSLNLVMRPGPWMVWVRYAFGIILVGAALYYLAHAGRLVPPLLFVVGFALALLIPAAVVYHLVKKQGDEVGSAGGKAAKIAILLCAATGLVAVLTKEPTYEGSGQPLKWTLVQTREELYREVMKAVAEGKPSVFDIRADWCENCKAFEELMTSNEEIHARLGNMKLLHLDNTDRVPGEAGVREGVAFGPQGQPSLAFIDAKGRLRNDLRVTKWEGKSKSSERLLKVLDSLGRTAPSAP